MPNILQTNFPESADFQSLITKDLGYEYPEGLDLRPTSELHKALKKEIIERARESRNEMQKRFDSWNEIDKTLTAYIKLIDKEQKAKDDDATKQKPMAIVFPYSYSVLETVLTYLIIAFIQDPILRYEGVSPEDTIGAILLESIIELQQNKSKAALAYHTMFRDGTAYGIGPIAPVWNERWGDRTRRVETGSIFGPKYTKEVREELLFEGNVMMNIDPYLFLPDPNVPIDRIQDGEFVGWVDIDNYTGLLDEEYSDPEMFNVKYLKASIGKHSQFAEKSSKRQDFIGGHRENRNLVSKRIDKINMYINLIPKDWGLSAREYPEKWLFILAQDSIIIKAQPLGLDHNLYPVAVCAPEFDGYSVTPISRIEVLGGLQKVLDWEFNSHVANVKKIMNDMLVVDPYLININDLKSPGPGKLIRMMRPAWGKGVKDAVYQLDVQDVTQNNISDAAMITHWMDRIGGADQSMSGTLRQGGPERLTGQEFEGTRTGAISRMERIARVIGLQAFQDIGYMTASHTQQLMSQETYIKAVGRWQEDLTREFGPNAKRIKVTPFDILCEYDMMVRDGSIPGGNFSPVWIKLFEVLGKHPILAERIDLFRVFSHIARNMGAKNVHEFEKIQTQVMPDENVMREAEKGNLVPFEGGA